MSKNNLKITYFIFGFVLITLIILLLFWSNIIFEEQFLNKIKNFYYNTLLNVIIINALYVLITLFNLGVFRYFETRYIIVVLIIEAISLYIYRNTVTEIIRDNSSLFLFFFVILYLRFLILSKMAQPYIDQKRIENMNKRQKIMYREFLLKHKTINMINFFFNAITTVLGSYTGPKNKKSFILFYLFFMLLSGFLVCFGHYRLTLTLGGVFIALAARYEAIYINYQENKAFRMNYKINSRYWDKKFSLSKNIIKRTYCREVIRVAMNKLGGSMTMVNPSARTLYVLGGGFLFVGTMGAGAYVVGKKIEHNTAIAVFHSNEKIHDSTLASSERQSNAQRVHELEMKKKEFEIKKKEFEIKKLEYENRSFREKIFGK